MLKRDAELAIAAAERLPDGRRQGWAGGRIEAEIAPPQPQRGPPAVVALGMVLEQVAPGGPGLVALTLLPLAEAQPETLAAHQPHRQMALDRGAQESLGPAPLTCQQGLAGPLPLQLPAGRMVGPALQHRQHGAAARAVEGAAGLNRGRVLQGCRQPGEGLQAGGPWLVAEQADGLHGQGGVGPGAGQLEQQVLAKGLLGGVAAEQALGQGQFGFRAGWLTVEAGQACLNVAELG